MTHRRLTAAFALTAGCLTALPALAEREPMDFAIEDGQVQLAETFATKVEVLGVAITSGGQQLPVTLCVHIGDDAFEPFGGYASPAQTGNLNDGHRRSFIIDRVFDPSDVITIEAQSWYGSDLSSAQDADYGTLYQRDSHEQSDFVRVLRHGDAVPDVSGFDGQADVAAYLDLYIDSTSNTMRLLENQVIYLYELGTSSATSSAADFQDLVVLVTLGKSPEELAQPYSLEASFD
ncbi:MAG: hypothetical protein AAF288_00295 [Planctomycetota bacterium]